MYKIEGWNGISVEWHGLDSNCGGQEERDLRVGVKSTACVDGQDLGFGQDIISKVWGVKELEVSGCANWMVKVLFLKLGKGGREHLGEVG